MTHHFDDDGYPTEAVLKAIREHLPWPPEAVFSLAAAAFNDCYGRVTTEEKDDGSLHLTFCTGGWSGNEDVMHALQSNIVAWTITWVSSERGGRFRFEIPAKMRAGTTEASMPTAGLAATMQAKQNAPGGFTENARGWLIGAEKSQEKIQEKNSWAPRMPDGDANLQIFITECIDPEWDELAHDELFDLVGAINRTLLARGAGGFLYWDELLVPRPEDIPGLERISEALDRIDVEGGPLPKVTVPVGMVTFDPDLPRVPHSLFSWAKKRLELKDAK